MFNRPTEGNQNIANQQQLSEEQALKEALAADEQIENDGDVNDLFATSTPGAVFGGANQLSKTAHLTAIATDITNGVFKTVMDQRPATDAKIAGSQKDHDAMDDLINEFYQLGAVDLTFLEGTDDDEAERMLRSQQSKRSRAKSKVMTPENYKTMMVGAVAENLLRIFMGKSKNAGGGAVMGEIGFSPEDLEMLATDREELKKAIRNVQSKKSIMKSKADFDEASPRWLQLLAAEEQLKAIRNEGNATVAQEAREALESKQKIEEALADVDIESLPETEAKYMLEMIRNMLAPK